MLYPRKSSKSGIIGHIRINNIRRRVGKSGLISVSNLTITKIISTLGIKINAGGNNQQTNERTSVETENMTTKCTLDIRSAGRRPVPFVVFPKFPSGKSVITPPSNDPAGQ